MVFFLERGTAGPGRRINYTTSQVLYDVKDPYQLSENSTATSKCYLLFTDICKSECTLHREGILCMCSVYIPKQIIDMDIDTKLIISVSKESDSKLKF